MIEGIQAARSNSQMEGLDTERSCLLRPGGKHAAVEVGKSHVSASAAKNSSRKHDEVGKPRLVPRETRQVHKAGTQSQMQVG